MRESACASKSLKEREQERVSVKEREKERERNKNFTGTLKEEQTGDLRERYLKCPSTILAPD